jgi:putative phosphoesterase
MKLGVISDTHNYFDPKIPDIFQGVDHILHGGDIGLPWIILELESIAPVTAVLGNNDLGLDFKEIEMVRLDGKKLLLHHIVDFSRPETAIHQRINKEKPNVVVFGHSHRALSETRGGIFYLNPGYAGKPRFNLRRSVAILSWSDAEISVEFKSL